MKVTEDGVPVQDVIAAVKLAIKEANISATDEGRDLQVASVKLTLHALATRTIGGGLSFTVPFIGMPVRLGTKVTKSDTHEIEVNLTPPGQEAGGSQTGICLDTSDVDADHAALQAAGVDVDENVTRWGGPVPPMFWLRDPDGNSLIIVQPSD